METVKAKRWVLAFCLVLVLCGCSGAAGQDSGAGETPPPADVSEAASVAEAPLPAEETAEDATSQREHAFRNIRFDFPGSVTVSGDMVQLAWGEDAVGTLSAIERGENLDRYEQEEDPFLMEMYLENIETDDRIFPPRLDDISVAGLPGRSASMAYQVEGRAYPATLLSFCDDEWYYCMIWVSAETDPEIASASMDVFLDMVESIVLV